MKRWIAVLLTSTLLSGCTSAQKKPLESLGVISAVGYDTGENGKLIGTVVLPNFTETGKEKVDVLTGSGHSLKEIRNNLSRLSERQLVSGQIRVAIYGEDLARKGILPLNDTMFRDAEIGSQIHLAVCEGRSVKFYTHRYPDKPSIDIYLYKMLRKEMDQNTIPKSNLHLFLRHVYDVGSDAVLPYLRLGKEDVIVDGSALFRNDVFVGRLNLDDTRLLSFLIGNRSNGEIDTIVPGTTPHGDSAHAVLMFLKLKRNIDVTKENNLPKFKIHLYIEGAVTEYTGKSDLEKPGDLLKVQTFMEQQMTKKMQKLISRLQKEFTVDPLGLGEEYRSKGFVAQMTRPEWEQLYKKSSIAVDVKLNILQTGMIH